MATCNCTFITLMTGFVHHLVSCNVIAHIVITSFRSIHSTPTIIKPVKSQPLGMIIWPGAFVNYSTSRGMCQPLWESELALGATKFVFATSVFTTTLGATVAVEFVRSYVITHINHLLPIYVLYPVSLKGFAIPRRARDCTRESRAVRQSIHRQQPVGSLQSLCHSSGKSRVLLSYLYIVPPPTYRYVMWQGCPLPQPLCRGILPRAFVSILTLLPPTPQSVGIPTGRQRG